jgi:hypothetical protein
MEQAVNHERTHIHDLLLLLLQASPGGKPTMSVRDTLASDLQRGPGAFTKTFYSILEGAVTAGEVVRVRHGREVWLAIPDAAHPASPVLSPAITQLSTIFKTLAHTCATAGMVVEQIQSCAEQGIDMAWQERMELFCEEILGRLSRIEQRLGTLVPQHEGNTHAPTRPYQRRPTLVSLADLGR